MIYIKSYSEWGGNSEMEIWLGCMIWQSLLMVVRDTTLVWVQSGLCIMAKVERRVSVPCHTGFDSWTWIWISDQ